MSAAPSAPYRERRCVLTAKGRAVVALLKLRNHLGELSDRDITRLEMEVAQLVDRYVGPCLIA